MSSLTLPFSLSDILERVIPGSILLVCLYMSFHELLDIPYSIGNKAITSAFFFAVSYAIGVSLNSLAGFIKIKGYRTYWTENPCEREKAIRDALGEHFKIVPDNDTWRLCYGTCIKNGYGSNTQLFLGLEVFCRGMTVTTIVSGIAFMISILLNITNLQEAKIFVIFAPISFILSWVFHRGAWIYSLAFVGSIYEGFFNWYCDNKKITVVDHNPSHTI